MGLWSNLNEGAKSWMSVLTELKNPGLQDVLIFCCDGLTGFPAAIEAVYPKAKDCEYSEAISALRELERS